MKLPKTSLKFQPRFRLMRGGDVALGPGKVELLEMVRRHGSIANAAAALGMSYMRAWTLIKTMQRCFKEPLLEVSRGGAKHGGARLTLFGERIVDLYRSMEEKSLRATQGVRRELLSHVRP